MRRRNWGWAVALLILVWWIQQPGGQTLTLPQVNLPGVGAQADAAPAGPPSSAQRAIGAREDIPARYVALYQRAARTCPRLTWQVLAGIGKVESNHGRSSAPGVTRGVNRHGCCAGPMQFNLTDGPPSTWDGYRRPGDSVYDPADAIPAAARKLCAEGLRSHVEGADPCPGVQGGAPLHRALKRYNNACWYVADVLGWADTYQT